MPPSTEADEQDVDLSVNVSPLQLTRKGFAEQIAAMINARGLSPARLCIEVTEGVFTNAEAVRTIGQIRELGVLVAVDDFGIGYSSLSTLQRLPADVVKLDRSFLPDPGAVLASEGSFLKAVVALAHTAGLKVVIEGVENQLQLNAAVRAGAEAIQGFHLARPMPNEAAMALVCQRNQERSWLPKLSAAQACLEGAVLEALPVSHAAAAGRPGR
jgi:EAL domain-containing protein (putative c-di-GMP-specific phosphodiesterase class I)